jgi:hypothetical protein
MSRVRFPHQTPSVCKTLIKKNPREERRRLISFSAVLEKQRSPTVLQHADTAGF